MIIITFIGIILTLLDLPEIFTRVLTFNRWVHIHPNIKNQMTYHGPSGMMYYTITDLIEKVVAPCEVIFAEEPELVESPEAVNHLETGISSF